MIHLHEMSRMGEFRDRGQISGGKGLEWGRGMQYVMGMEFFQGVMKILELNRGSNCTALPMY